MISHQQRIAALGRAEHILLQHTTPFVAYMLSAMTQDRRNKAFAELLGFAPGPYEAMVLLCRITECLSEFREVPDPPRRHA